MRRREREKTIRLAIVMLTIVAIIAIVVPNQTKSQVIPEVYETDNLAAEDTEEDDATVLGIVMLTGIVTFEAATFKWIIKKEKEGYVFTDSIEEK